MFQDLTPEQYLARLEDGELWQLLDVRESWEVAIARIPASVHIPMAEVPFRLDELDPGRPVAVLCHGGRRSAEIAALLVRSGFVNVVNIEGGIDAWSQEVDYTIPRY